MTTNRIASFAVALWCVARLYQRGGAGPALYGAIGVAALLAIIWFSVHWANLLKQGRQAQRALPRQVPPLAISLIGWLLLVLYCAALVATPARLS